MADEGYSMNRRSRARSLTAVAVAMLIHSTGAGAQGLEDFLGYWRTDKGNCSPDNANGPFLFRQDGLFSHLVSCRTPLTRRPDGGYSYSGTCQFEDGPDRMSIAIWFGHDDRLIARIARGGRTHADFQLFRCQ
jgi:hypothetical protein